MKKSHLILRIFACIILLGLLLVGLFIYPKLKTYEDETIKIVNNSKIDDFKITDTQTLLTYEEIPQNVINAFISVEDRTFFENDGVDYIGIIKALYENIFLDEKLRGASTITQQLSRTIYLTREKTLDRKIKEIFVAKELSKKYSKEQIITFYINTCCFSNAIYGIEDASKTYFGKTVSNLSLAETAYLCAIPNRPAYFDPYIDINRPKERQEKILNDMYELSFISKDELEEALNEEIIIKK